MPKPLVLTDARYYRVNHYPSMAVNIDGIPAVFTTEWRPGHRKLGIVPLHPAAFAHLPPIPVEVVPGDPDTLARGTYDRRLVVLIEDFWDACNHLNGRVFMPGPVAIPD
jgi:hypothetical protein